MSIIGGLANLGAVVQGYERFQQQDQQIQAQRQRNKEALDDAASLAILGEAFGMAPQQGQPQPPAPGQASQPAPQPQPMSPQAGPVPAPAPGQPGPVPAARPLMPAQPSAPPVYAPGNPQGDALRAGLASPQGQALQTAQRSAIPSDTPQGQPAQATPARSQPLMPGAMTIESVKERILANPRTAAMIKKDPSLLVRALNKAVPFINEEGRQKLAEANQDLKAAQLQAKIDQANQKLEMTKLSIEEKQRAMQEANQLRLQIAQMQDSTKRAGLEQAMALLLTKIAGQKDLQGQKDTAAKDRLGMSLNSKERISAATNEVKKELGEAKNLNDANKIQNTEWYQKRQTELKEQQLSDAAVRAQLDHEVKLIQEQGRNDRKELELTEKAREFDISDATKRKASEDRLKAITTKAQAGSITEDEAKFFASAMDTDPTIVLRMMGAGGAGTAAKQQIAKAFAARHPDDPGALARAEVTLSGAKAGMQTAARQGAKVDIGAKEIEPFGKNVLAAAQNLGSTEYSTWNAIRNAIIARKPGSEKLVALNDAITNYRNALIQVAQRGGATSEGAQARADKYINENMSIPSIISAVKSGKIEAEIAQGAVKGVKEDIVRSAGGAAPGETPSAKTAEVPKGLPSPEGHEEGSVAKDKSGKVVAVIKDGQWVAPDAGQ